MDAIASPVSVMKTTAATTTSRGSSLAKFQETAKDFEAVFMAQMIKPMFEGIETRGMFGGGPGEEVMRDLMVQEYGKALVRNDEYGLSPAIMREMIRIQEQASTTKTGGAG